jgi:hypothetical protein
MTSPRHPRLPDCLFAFVFRAADHASAFSPIEEIAPSLASWMPGALLRPVPPQDREAVSGWLAEVGSPIAGAEGYVGVLSERFGFALLATKDGHVTGQPACLLQDVVIERVAASVRSRR